MLNTQVQKLTHDLSVSAERIRTYENKAYLQPIPTYPEPGGALKYIPCTQNTRILEIELGDNRDPIRYTRVLSV